MALTGRKVPEHCDVLIIGGGPAGSSAAIQLAQDGFAVVLLERAEFPRNQVGESLIPHFWKFTDALGVSEKIQQQGFITKSGGITVWENKIKQIKFSDFGYTRPGLHVERDVFDALLLQHARDCGAEIFTCIAVRQVDFSDAEYPRVTYLDKRGDAERQTQQLRCRYVIDASGHSTFLANQFKTRQLISAELNFLSLWGYFKNACYIGVDSKSHAPEELSQVKPVTFVLSHEAGWLWHIILRGKTSVGLITHTQRTKGMDRGQRECFFLQTCRSLPYLSRLLEVAEFIPDSLQFRPDYSYFSQNICGANYYCIGDAAAFVDPIFSHGVQNAFYNAATACMAIKQSFKNPQNRLRYSQLCASRMQQFYGFSRALSLGDFGVNGVEIGLVKALMKAMPPLELELMWVASEMTNRSENFRRIACEAGVWEKFQVQAIDKKSLQLASLQL